MTKNILALLALLFLSPFIGEIVTGNTSIGSLTPPLILMTLLLYGVGAILVRETALRWHKGFTTILILGLAYGAIEEGLVTEGFFNPDFYAVIAFGMENFGRVGGINVLWALAIMLFHAIFSIAIPIVLVNALFGRDRWLSSSIYFLLLAVFAANAFVFNQVLSTHGNFYAPNPLSWLAVCLLITLLILVARLWSNPTVENKVTPNSFLLFILGFGISALYFILSRAFLFFIHNALANVVVLVLFSLIVGWQLRRYLFSPRGTVALACGLMIPVLATSIRAGMLPIAIVMILLLVLALLKAKTEPI